MQFARIEDNHIQLSGSISRNYRTVNAVPKGKLFGSCQFSCCFILDFTSCNHFSCVFTGYQHKDAAAKNDEKKLEGLR